MCEPWVPDWVVSCKTKPDNTDWVVSGLILTIWDESGVPDWVVSCKTDTWEYRLSRSRIYIDYGITKEPWVLDRVVSCKTDT